MRQRVKTTSVSGTMAQLLQSCSFCHHPWPVSPSVIFPVPLQGSLSERNVLKLVKERESRKRGRF